MPWSIKGVIIVINSFGLIGSSKNFVHKMNMTEVFGKSDHTILELGVSWEGYSLDKYS